VEVMFPIQQTSLKKYLLDQILPIMFADNVKAREMQADGSYKRVTVPEGTVPVRSQLRLIERLPLEDNQEATE